MNNYKLNEDIVFTVKKGVFALWNLTNGEQYQIYDTKYLDRIHELTTLTGYRVINPKLQAITHTDGTARVQTVAHDDNPLLHSLLTTFKEVSGAGVLCNTSLNFSGAGFINNRSDLEKFCTDNEISTFVIDDIMYTRMDSTTTRQYSYLYGIRFCSSATVWLDFILIFSTLTFIFHAQAETLALAAALYGIPSLIFGPYIGSLPDRYSPHAIIAVSFCLRAVTAICLFQASSLDIFLALIALKGLSNLGSTPAEIVLTTRLLPPERIIKNTSLVSITDQTIKIIAPLAAGLSITLSNSTYGFLVSGLLSINGLAFTWLLKQNLPHTKKYNTTRQKTSLREVFDFFVSHTTAQAFLLCMLIQSAALGTYDSLLSLFMRELSLSSSSFGQVVSATALGGIIAGFAFPKLYQRHILLCATVASSIFGVCLLTIATAGFNHELFGTYSFPALFLIAGFAYGLTSQGFTSTLQLTCPSNILGTAFSTARSCSISLFIVLPAAGAWLAGITSIASVIMTTGLITLISAILLHIYYLQHEASDGS